MWVQAASWPKHVGLKGKHFETITVRLKGKRGKSSPQNSAQPNKAIQLPSDPKHDPNLNP
jgi:hypothetical protein